MCGVPTVTFNHGEAVFEEVLDNNTGFVVKQNDNQLYVKKLEYIDEFLGRIPGVAFASKEPVTLQLALNRFLQKS